MKTNKTILLDMDGVIANWHEAACNLYNTSVEECLTECPPPWPYAIHEQIGRVRQRKLSYEEFWIKIINTEHFWMNIETYPYAMDFVIKLSQISSKVYIVTNPGEDIKAWTNKVAWLQAKLRIRLRDIFVGYDKYLMAKEDVLLIDDSSKNITDFIGAGGKGLLFPQPWNDADKEFHKSDKTINQIILQCLDILNS